MIRRDFDHHPHVATSWSVEVDPRISSTKTAEGQFTVKLTSPPQARRGKEEEEKKKPGGPKFRYRRVVHKFPGFFSFIFIFILGG